MTEHKTASPYRAQHDLVFPTSHGTPQGQSNVIRRILRPAVRRANEKLAAEGKQQIRAIKMHDLRRTAASLLFEAGATVPYVMQQLGHENPQVTLRIYTQVLQRHPEVGTRVDDLLKGSERATGDNLESVASS